MKKIIGYQVVNDAGECWDTQSFEVLSEYSAIFALEQARKKSNDFKMVAVLEGDIENPSFC